MNELTYALIYKKDVININWFDVEDLNPSTLRYNNEGTMTYVRFTGHLPHSIQLIHKGLYSHESMLEILTSDQWVDLSECDGCPCTEYYKSEGMEI